MIWVQVEAQSSIAIVAPTRTVFAYIADVCKTAKHFPGIDRTEVLGNGLYRYVLTERRTLGQSLIGEYVARYVEEGNTVVWTTTQGNMRSDGIWTIDGNDQQTRLSVKMSTGFDVQVPALLKKPIAMFARGEVQRCAETQLSGLKRAIEAEQSARFAQEPADARTRAPGMGVP